MLLGVLAHYPVEIDIYLDSHCIYIYSYSTALEEAGKAGWQWMAWDVIPILTVLSYLR